MKKNNFFDLIYYFIGIYVIWVLLDIFLTESDEVMGGIIWGAFVVILLIFSAIFHISMLVEMFKEFRRTKRGIKRVRL